jgi:magnesium transporter
MAPGVPVLTGEALPPRIHVIRYDASAIEEHNPKDAAACLALVGAGAITWIDVQGLADLDLLRALGEGLGLHPLALEDVVSLGQRPKVEDYDTHLFVIARMPEPGEPVTTDQTSLFLRRDLVLTFQERYGDCLDGVRERLRKGKGAMRRSGPDYLAYAILDAIVDGYFPVLESLGERLEDLEGEVVTRPTRPTLEKIHRAKRDLLALRRAIWPLRDAVNALIREEHELVAPPTRVYLRDCYDHAVQILDMVETDRELAGGLMDIYISSLSQRLNEVMKVLTIIATIFIPLTFVVGVYGMNFRHMPELEWRYGYPLVMLLMATMGAGMVVYFARRGWLGKDSLPEAPPRSRRTTTRKRL